jgi:hypothetical protein
MEEVDVIVVGAGLAGLHTAGLLQARGLSVRVLEARERVGGRAHTVALPPPAPPGCIVDVGGQWVGPEQPRMLALIQQLGLELEEQAWPGAYVPAVPACHPSQVPSTLGGSRGWGLSSSGGCRHPCGGTVPHQAVETALAWRRWRASQQLCCRQQSSGSGTRWALCAHVCIAT